MLKVIVSSLAFEREFENLDWHDAFVRETHFVPGIYTLTETGQGGKIDRFTACTDCSLVRILLAYPCAGVSAEIVGFDPTGFTINLHKRLESKVKSIEIKRRFGSLDFGTFSVAAGALAYKFHEAYASGKDDFLSSIPTCNDRGQLAYPYDVDWRMILDKSFAANK